VTNLRRVILIAALLATQARAQQAAVKLVVPPGPVEVGEVIDAQLVCTNTGTPSRPSIAKREGLDVRLLSDSPMVSRQTTIINGRRSSRVTHTFNLRVIARKPGKLLLGPIHVEADGKRYKAEAVPVSVSKPTDPGPRGDQYVIATLDVQPRQLYVTESYTATLTIGIRKVVLNGREYEIDMLRQVLDLSASQISIFGGGQATRSERWIEDSAGRRNKYEFYRVTRRMTAEEAGTIEIGPIFLKADYPTAVRRGFFGRPEISRTRRETARADAVEVTVLDPPLDSRPADFTGAIGRYSITAVVKPDRVELGQPVTLTLTIKGSPIEGVAGPDLAAIPELRSRFDFTQDELVGDLEDGAKVFRRALFPRQAGEQTVPFITWSYFDTKREEYVTLETEPIDIVVDAPAQSSDRPPAFDLPEPRRDATTLTVVSGGIAPNYVDASTVLADQSTTLVSPAVATTLLLPPIACLGVAASWRRRQRLSSDRGYARARRAATKATTAVRRALNEPRPADRLSGIAVALSMFVSDRFNAPQATPTAAECAQTLRERGYNDQLVESVTEFLEQCEALRYAPSAAESVSPQDAARDVRAWIRTIDRGAP